MAAMMPRNASKVLQDYEKTGPPGTWQPWIRHFGCQFFLIFSSILNMPFGAPTNMRLKVLGRQRRSSVLRRGRERSAMSNPLSSVCAAARTGEKTIFYSNLDFSASPFRECRHRLEPVLPAGVL